jgi:hypothetical protein
MTYIIGERNVDAKLAHEKLGIRYYVCNVCGRTESEKAISDDGRCVRCQEHDIAMEPLVEMIQTMSNALRLMAVDLAIEKNTSIMVWTESMKYEPADYEIEVLCGHYMDLAQKLKEKHDAKGTAKAST